MSKKNIIILMLEGALFGAILVSLYGLISFNLLSYFYWWLPIPVGIINLAVTIVLFNKWYNFSYGYFSSWSIGLFILIKVFNDWSVFLSFLIYFPLAAIVMSIYRSRKERNSKNESFVSLKY
jgi:hypothetical protein